MAETPDSLLADGLSAIGVDVTTAPPNFRGDWRPYDIVHLNHLTNACLRALAPSRQRIVFTHHTSGWKPWHHRLVRNAVERRADRVVVFTEDERRRLGRHVQGDKVAVIRSALAVERFGPEPHRAPAPGEPWELLYVGQLVAFKRVHLALELVRRMRAAGHPTRLRIISHRDTLRPDLEAEARRLGVADAVEYLGTRTRDEIGPEMAKSHFLVLPSHREALSTVTSEAALTALPVLLFDVSGADEQVPGGWERPHPDDAERWFDLALRRVDHYAEAAAAFEQNATTVRDRLGIDRAVQEHVELYRSLL
ncbi:MULTISPECIES: glycosyltransferase family 4 protein [unclassified Curtobacterium]|uniref:glycosyltransferase family 4 protein n=1 Tax=unclassified Curtobacterium TaxID=257496 RepID=UPI0021AC1C2C|nr:MULTISPECIES: glycosyltransferase family 4 protein [unclassified Curtobacterium]